VERVGKRKAAYISGSRDALWITDAETKVPYKFNQIS